MNRPFTLIALFAVLFAGCQENKPEDKTEPEPGPVVPVPGFAKGADVSWVSEMEKGGRTFRLKDGSPADIFDVLKETGINAIRLRVWVDPTGGWSGPEDVVRQALSQTVERRLEHPENYLVSVPVTVRLTFQDSRWQVEPEESLWQVLSGRGEGEDAPTD